MEPRPNESKRYEACKASITGRLEFADSKGHPNTIYVSIGDRAFKDIVPDRACVAKPEFLDTAKVKPADNVDKYIAKLTVSLVGDGSVVGLATSRGRVLRPWQAYMTYEVQDNLFLTATCGYGFAVGNVSDAPEADVKVFDRALLDLNEFRGKASPAVLRYTCTRVVPPGGD